jgi:GntR family transcriptional repressor for pyruvate dehydrogenase complex
LTAKDIIFYHPGVTVHKLPQRGTAARTGETLATGIVAAVRDALFEGRYRPGDFLGTEKDLAARHNVSRMAARDALRSLQAMGVVDIRRGVGGGARISRGNPQHFAEALAIQLELAGIGAEEILVAQHGVECLAAELAASRASGEDIERLKALVERAGQAIDDHDLFTRLSLEFHLAVADGSGNRVLHYQLVSLQHVSWPSRNRTLTHAVARHVLDAHGELVRLIAARDVAGARQAMDAHVGMIGGRRLVEKKGTKHSAFC